MADVKVQDTRLLKNYYNDGPNVHSPEGVVIFKLPIAVENSVNLFLVSKHSGMLGNKKADSLANRGSKVLD